MVRRLLVFLLLFFPLVLARGEMSTSVEIGSLNAASRDDEGNISLTSLGMGTLDFKSRGNNNVKGELEVKAVISDLVLLDIPRAYMKARFSGLRLTLGKTRVSWGDGFLFNAGDLVFDGMSLDVTDFSASVLRDETTTLLSLAYYFDNFTFLEALGLTYPTTVSYNPVGVDFDTLSGGIRFYSKLGGVILEQGYLYDGKSNQHKIALSLSGGLMDWVDWNLSVGGQIPGEDPAWDVIREELTASFGVFKTIGIDSLRSFTLRLEGGLFPWKAWTESAPGTVYGLYLYPEGSLSLSDTMSFQLRSLLSPVEAAGMVMAGFGWAPYQGFSLDAMGIGQFGEPGDTFGWDRAGDLAFMINLTFLYGE